MTASRAVPRAPRLAAASTSVLALAFDAGAVLLLIPQAGDAASWLDGNTLGGFVLGATFPIVGWIIAARRPGNAIGWIFLGVGLSQALDTFASQYATVGLVAQPGSLPAADILAWISVWAWAPGFTLLLTMSVLLFPDGRLPSARWRPVVWLAAVALVLLVVPIATIAWPTRGRDLLGPGPVQSDDPLVAAMIGLQFVGLVLLAVAALSSVAGLIVRFRRSTGIERAQLKWVVSAGTVEVALLSLSAFLNVQLALLNVLLTLVISPLLPVAALIAIFRYRLYEIDRLVSRSVSYLVVTGVLGAVFAALVVALQGPFAAFTGGNEPAVAASTLAVAASFQPVRRRVQRVVDRRFNRSRFDAERVVASFLGKVRDEVEVGSVVRALDDAIDRTVQPVSAAVWIREGAR